MHQQKFPLPEPFTGAGHGGGIKRIPSELVLEAAYGEGLFGEIVNSSPAVDIPHFTKDEETMNGIANYEGFVGSQSWCQSINPQQPCVSATIDSQSSICAGSPTSTLKPKAGDNQGSGSSEEEDAETEDGPCEKSNDDRRKRRMASNRESAQRSRRRKQAQLQDLEMLAEQLSGENVNLYQQMTDADQRLKNATTNNRVLKSDVEALRAKVKLAEDMVTRGSLSCSLNQFLQTHLGSNQLLNANPTFMIQGQDAAFGATFSGINNDNVDHILNWNAGNGLGNEDVSCVTDIWPGPGVDQ